MMIVMVAVIVMMTMKIVMVMVIVLMGVVLNKWRFQVSHASCTEDPAAEMNLLKLLLQFTLVEQDLNSMSDISVICTIYGAQVHCT